jgi:hypothetical protein
MVRMAFGLYFSPNWIRVPRRYHPVSILLLFSGAFGGNAALA